jgi:hypothetical protein
MGWNHGLTFETSTVREREKGSACVYGLREAVDHHVRSTGPSTIASASRSAGDR